MTGNKIEHIPVEIQKLQYLVSLRLERNKIKNISEVMHLCHLHNLVTLLFVETMCIISAFKSIYSISIKVSRYIRWTKCIVDDQEESS